MTNPSSPVTPRLSAAVMLLRRADEDGTPEVFMVRRPVQSEFAPDVYVFPGGSVHESDREAEVTAGVCVPIDTLSEATALGAGVRVAAVRELFEEAGVLLAVGDAKQPFVIPADAAPRYADYRRQIQRQEISLAEVAAAEDIVLATDALNLCAHWITPETFPKRFTTYFFTALHPTGQEAVHDDLETTHGLWVRPATALARHDAGDFPLVFATIHQLRDLAAFKTPVEALNAWRSRIPVTIMPRVIERDGAQVIVMPGEAN